MSDERNKCKICGNNLEGLVIKAHLDYNNVYDTHESCNRFIFLKLISRIEKLEEKLNEYM